MGVVAFLAGSPVGLRAQTPPFGDDESAGGGHGERSRTLTRSYSCDTGSPNLHFTDIAASNPFCKHIHFLWAKGIVDGCTATTYCPGLPVTRDAMAKFLVNAFGLALYGPQLHKPVISGPPMPFPASEAARPRRLASGLGRRRRGSPTSERNTVDP